MRRLSRIAFIASVSMPLLGCGDGGSDSADDGHDAGVSGIAGDQIVLHTTPVHVEAGREEYRCQYFPPPGKSGWIDRIDVPSLAGFHHVLVFRVKDDPKLSRVPAPCPNDFADLSDEQLPVPFNGVFETPPGVAFECDEDDGFFLQLHFLNTSTKPIDASMSWGAHLAPASSVVHPAGMLRFINDHIKLPPHEEVMVTDTCPLPIDIQMFEAGGHYHQLAVDFKATIAGEMALEGISDRTRTIDPPRVLRAGDPVVWTCDDVNTTATEIDFGPSFAKNEMCNFAIYGFPVPSSKTFKCR